MNRLGPFIAVIVASMAAFACDPKTPVTPNPPKPIAQKPHTLSGAFHEVVARGG